MRGADLVAKTLSKAGVEVIFTLSGNQIMPIFDACIDAGIRLIHTRHEGAAVYMAEAYAQLTGRVGIAMTTAAPGFASGLGPLYTARMSESPIILLCGDSPLCQDGKGAFQEMDQVSIAAPLTKFSLRPRHAEDIGSDLAKALRIATSGRPGPVHVALPFDLLNADASDADVPAAADFVRLDQRRPLTRRVFQFVVGESAVADGGVTSREIDRMGEFRKGFVLIPLRTAPEIQRSFCDRSLCDD